MNYYNVENDSTAGGNYGLHDQVDFQIDNLVFGTQLSFISKSDQVNGIEIRF